MNGADPIAGILKLKGIDHILTLLHSDIIDAAARGGIRPIIVHQALQATPEQPGCHDVAPLPDFLIKQD